jgi:hypothetical protein
VSAERALPRHLELRLDQRADIDGDAFLFVFDDGDGASDAPQK